jgi:aarF domain-containing kinase
MVSKEGKVIRQQLCKVIADALCQWMIKLFGQGATDTQYPRVMLADGPSNKESGRSSSAAYDYNSIFRDRRLRVIFSKVVKSASSDKVLMLRFCWSSLVIMITASTLACHRVVLSLSEAYLGPIFDAPKRTRYAVNA